MDRVKIVYDFNGYLKYGYDQPVPLSKTDCEIDSNGNEIVLSEGMDIRIYEIDYDVFGRQDNLYADGTAVCNPDGDGGFKWWFQINSLGIKHESDDPDFHLPELSVDEKRNIVYKGIEREISLIGNGRDGIVKGQIEFYLRTLRELDQGEL